MTILCLASYFKGVDFLRAAKREGARVLLLTSLSLKAKEDWPADIADEIFYMPDDKEGMWNPEHTRNAVSYFARTEKIDRIVPLDDFDLELAASLREHFRIPGLGESATRYFRDKLAMRKRAQEAGLRVPAFSPLFHDADVNAFLQNVPGPWMFKPRSMAGAIGIKKVHTPEEVWEAIHAVGDLRSHYLLEAFVPGDVFHVDTLNASGKVVFEIASAYGRPPMEVAHGGGVFTTRVVPHGGDLEHSLFQANRALLSAFELERGASHSEFIKAHADQEIYFLETSARVGGANIADMVSAASGINLWAEWARLELTGDTATYELPPVSNNYAALLVSLAKDPWPDTSHFGIPEIVWRMSKLHHVGLVIQSPSYERTSELLQTLTHRVLNEFTATLPARGRALD